MASSDERATVISDWVTRIGKSSGPVTRTLKDAYIQGNELIFRMFYLFSPSSGNTSGCLGEKKLRPTIVQDLHFHSFPYPCRGIHGSFQDQLFLQRWEQKMQFLRFWPVYP